MSHAQPVDHTHRWIRRRDPAGLLYGWPLRRKIAAAVTVPLIAALCLGVSVVTGKIRDAARLEAGADGVQVIAEVVELSVATTALLVAQHAGQARGEDTARLDTALAAVRARDPHTVPGGADNYRTMIATSAAIRADATTTDRTTAHVLDTAVAIRAGARTVTEAAVAPLTDPVIVAAAARLVDTQNASGELTHQASAVAGILTDTSHAVRDLRGALTSERALLQPLSRRYPPDDPRLTRLREAIDTRFGVAARIEAGEPVPWATLRASLLDSTAIYTTSMHEAADHITTTARQHADTASRAATTATAAALAALLTTVAAALVVARSIVVPLARLRTAAHAAATKHLPAAVAAVKAGADPDEDAVPLIPPDTDEEIGDVADAVDSLQTQALALAADETQLRRRYNGMFAALAARSRALVDHQLRVIEAMETDQTNPTTLGKLFKLDNLATRQRRLGDNLLVLTGAAPGHTDNPPLPLADVLRAAASEVERYQRIHITTTPPIAIDGPAVVDLVHLLAELLDNALTATPPQHPVTITTTNTRGGVVVSVIDHGTLTPNHMTALNTRLAHPSEPDPTTPRHMGLFVVAHLAARHHITVRLRPTSPATSNSMGTVAVVTIPNDHTLDMPTRPHPATVAAGAP